MNFIIHLTIYPYDIMFSVGESNKAFLKEVDKAMPPKYRVDISEDLICNMPENVRGRTWHHLEGGQTIVRLGGIPKSAEEMGTLSHEIFHAVDIIFRRIGMKLCAESDEAYAYCIGYVTERFWEEVKKAQ